MNKKILKKFLILIGTMYLFIVFLLIFSNTKDIFESLSTILDGLFINFNTIFLPGIIFIISGFIIDNEIDSNSLKKYKKIRCIGLVPIYGILFYGCLSTVIGTSFMEEDTAGLNALILTFLAFIMSPCFFISLVLIIISSFKIMKIKHSKNKELNELNTIAEIREYKKLFDEGAISQEEFEEKKKRLLNL